MSASTFPITRQNKNKNMDVLLQSTIAGGFIVALNQKWHQTFA